MCALHLASIAALFAGAAPGYPPPQCAQRRDPHPAHQRADGKREHRPNKHAIVASRRQNDGVHRAGRLWWEEAVVDVARGCQRDDTQRDTNVGVSKGDVRGEGDALPVGAHEEPPGRALEVHVDGDVREHEMVHPEERNVEVAHDGVDDRAGCAKVGKRERA
eukprot:546467-Prymnesium_polylepis.2